MNGIPNTASIFDASQNPAAQVIGELLVVPLLDGCRVHFLRSLLKIVDKMMPMIGANADPSPDRRDFNVAMRRLAVLSNIIFEISKKKRAIFRIN
jgi:hypothetical protein